MAFLLPTPFGNIRPRLPQTPPPAPSPLHPPSPSPRSPPPPPAPARMPARCAFTDPNAALTAPELAEWARVANRVAAVLGPAAAQEGKADRLVARAFGWGTQKFWRGRLVDQAPTLAAAAASLEFLRDVLDIGYADGDGNGGGGEGAAKVIVKFPEVLALRVESMRENVDTLQKTYPNLKGPLLTRAVIDNPAVLGYDFDCEGDCKSECARCWVQF